MSNMYYLAAPYTDPDPEVRAFRVEVATLVAAWLMEKHGFCVYSPLTHSALIVPHLSGETVSNHNFWMRQCLPMVKAASGLIILTAPGWRESKGVRMEVEAAYALRMPIYRLDFGKAFAEQYVQNHLEGLAALAECYADAIEAGELYLFRYPDDVNPFHTTKH